MKEQSMRHEDEPLASRVQRLCVRSLVLALAVLSGCAGSAWERGVYEGWRSANQRGAPRDGAPQIDAPARLPGYDDYERERQRARNGDAVPTGAAPPAPGPAAPSTR
jgi:hypothetical protein